MLVASPGRCNGAVAVPRCMVESKRLESGDEKNIRGDTVNVQNGTFVFILFFLRGWQARRTLGLVKPGKPPPPARAMRPTNTLSHRLARERIGSASNLNWLDSRFLLFYH